MESDSKLQLSFYLFGYTGIKTQKLSQVWDSIPLLKEILQLPLGGTKGTLTWRRC